MYRQRRAPFREQRVGRGRPARSGSAVAELMPHALPAKRVLHCVALAAASSATTRPSGPEALRRCVVNKAVRERHAHVALPLEPTPKPRWWPGRPARSRRGTLHSGAATLQPPTPRLRSCTAEKRGPSRRSVAWSLRSRGKRRVQDRQPASPAGSPTSRRPRSSAAGSSRGTTPGNGGIGLLTPEQVHSGRAPEVIRQRQDVLAAAYAARPERFVAGPPHAAEPSAEVWINPPLPVCAVDPAEEAGDGEGGDGKERSLN